MDSLRLLKLHGSTNWYWTPGDSSGVSLARRVLPGDFGSPEPYEERDRRRELPGRSPFIVPPSATKSTYYRNPVVRELWTQAADALRDANSVALLGYSIPVADATVSAMFQQTLESSAAPVRVVDLAPDAVTDRVSLLGIDRRHIGRAGLGKPHRDLRPWVLPRHESRRGIGRADAGLWLQLRSAGSHVVARSVCSGHRSLDGG